MVFLRSIISVVIIPNALLYQHLCYTMSSRSLLVPCLHDQLQAAFLMAQRAHAKNTLARMRMMAQSY